MSRFLFSTLRLLCLLPLLWCNNASAQYWLMAPQVPNFAIVNQPSATLNQVLDTMLAHANVADTLEGGEMDQLKTFRSIWQDRVSLNDTTGPNMFQSYFTAVSAAITARLASPCTALGNWKLAGPDTLQVQASGYVNDVWAGSGALAGVFSNHYLQAGLFYFIQ